MVTAKTINLGIIGDPVEHSFSPRMHNFISEQMGVDYIYTAFEVSPKNLSGAIDGMRALGIRGINVTAPHKIEVMKYLDEISSQARILGSVNTVVNRDGRLCGYNTDADGFYAALENAKITVRGSRILVIGAGGVVAPTVIRLAQAQPKDITIINRTSSKAVAVADAVFKATGIKPSVETDGDYDIVINTTSAGMEPQLDALPTDAIPQVRDLEFIHSGMAIVDMIYNPARTRFLKIAQERGARTLNGLDMLIYQGIIAYELFTDIKLPTNMAEKIRKEVFGV